MCLCSSSIDFFFFFCSFWHLMACSRVLPSQSPFQCWTLTTTRRPFPTSRTASTCSPTCCQGKLCYRCSLGKAHSSDHFLEPISAIVEMLLSALLQLTAVDPDAGQNGEVTYRILAGDLGKFHLDSR